MSLTVGVDPRLTSVLRGVGLLGADGSFQTTWFDHPLDALRRCLEDETQRAAIFSLLDEVLPPSTGGFADAMRPTGARWHALLEDNPYGNLYLTVAGDLVGCAAVVGTALSDYPQIEATVSIPLMRTGRAGVASVVGTSAGPIEFGVRAELGPDENPSAVGIRFSVDDENGVRAAVRLEDGGAVAEFDPAKLDARAVDALQLLVSVAMEHEANADRLVQRLVKHLPGMLGLGDPALTPLPLTDPASIRPWFTSIVSTPATLKAWFTHVAGAIGAGDLTKVDPAIAGLGTVASPLRATIIDLPGDFSLELLLGAATTPSTTLHVGVGVSTPIDTATIGAQVTLAALPFDGQPAMALPDVTVGVSVPVAGGSIDGGVVWDGTRIVPNLRLVNVTVAGKTHNLDLTDAHAVVAEAADTVLDTLGDSLGVSGLGTHLLALLGVHKPSGAPAAWPSDLVLGADAFSGNLLSAIADLHRRILDDPGHAHPWSLLLSDLAGLLGLDNDVVGDGTRDKPWTIALVTSDVVELRLAAWNDRTASDPADVQRLRLGLQVGSVTTGWSLALSTEVLAFDFQQNHPTATRFVGAQYLRLSIDQPPTADIADFAISADSIALTAHWLPGTPADVQFVLAGLAVGAGADAVGPLTIALPGLDLSGADARSLIQMLVSRVWSLFGADQTAHIVSGLFGLHDTLPELPSDWPTIFDDIDSLDALLADPLSFLIGYGRKILTRTSIEATPFAATALAWLAPLLAGEVPDSAQETPATTLSGAGTYDDPWLLPIVGATADLLVWLEPGPMQDLFFDPTLEIRAATYGEQLIRAMPTSDLLFARDPVLTGNALDELSLWLASGDGLIPYDSQIAVPTAWTVRTPVALPHDQVTGDSAVIAAVQKQLATWGQAPVLLLTTTPATDWTELLKTLEPGHDPDAHLNLNSSLDSVTSVAHCYPVTLRSGDPVPQIHQAVARVRQLTRAAKVALVGHGPGGVAARQAADSNVLGVVTLCAPHAGLTLDPLVRDDLADAVRFADQLGAPSVSRLREILDGGPAVAGVLPPADTYTVAAFIGVPDPTTATVPGLAIGSKLGGDLVTELAALAAARPQSPVLAATHVGVGARVRLATTSAAVDEGEAALSLRADFLRLRIGDGPEPERPAHRLTFLASYGVQGGYLVGDAGARTDGTSRAATRVRWAEFGAHLDRAAVGGVEITPIARLVEAAGPGANPKDLTTADLIEALVGDPIEMPGDLVGAADLARQCMQALGVLTAGGDIDGAKLRVLLTNPGTAVPPHLPALVGVVAQAVGAVKVGDIWTLPILGDSLKLTLEESPWRVGVIAADTENLDSTAGLAAGLELDASVTLPGFVPSAAMSVQVGVLRIGWHDRQLELSAPPWLAPVRLAPNPDPTAIGAALEAGLPRVLLSTALAVFVAPAIGGVTALDRLFFEPSEFLRDTLGNGNGGFSADKVNTLLDAIATALGIDTSNGDHQSMPLPGDLVLHAVEPFELRLHGDIPVPLDETSLSIELGLRIDDHLNVSPTGQASLKVDLEGHWSSIQIDVGIAATGLALAVTPSGTNRIELLPHFDGLGALASAATALLPHVLQQLVDELTPASPWLAKVLEVAAALGIYGPDSDGFELPARSQELTKMLQPGWLAGLSSDSSQIADKIAALFQLVPLPLGHIQASNGLVDWVVPIDGVATVTTGFGWQRGEPLVTFETADLRLGPVVVTTATLGWDGRTLHSAITTKLDTQGVLAPLHAAVQIALDGDRFSVQVLPLGPETGDEFALTLAPQLAVVATEQAAVDMVVQWALPLAAELMLVVFDDTGTTSLLERPFWNGGPNARDVLAGAGVVPGPVTSPPVLANPLPDPLDALLGAVQAVASGVSLKLTDSLHLSLVTDPVKHLSGVRVSGSIDIPADDSTVTVRFGSVAASVGDTGLTLWVVKVDNANVELRPAISAEGFGVVVSGDPLVDGTFTMGAAGGFVYFDADFTEPDGSPGVHVTELGAGLTIQQAFFTLDSQDGDSFLAKIIPPQLEAPFDLTIEYRDGHLHVSTTAPGEPDKIELILPLDIDLTIIQITELLLALRLDPQPISIEVAISGGADLGPLVARIKRVGVIVRIGPGGGLAFRAPDEVGLSIDTSTLTLAGFLLVDSEHGRYVGGIEIAVLDTFQLTAIGIIITKPDFSLLFIVSMKLPVPITLGYGFFFTGAGGLLGLNRGFELSELVGRLKTGAAESILFPTDIVRRADAIVRDLEAVFPPAPGQFLVGPMIEISWSTPPLITIQLGIVLSIGRLPPVVAIIGLVRAALPDKDDAVLDLKVAFVGAVNVGAQLLRFDASIYDSYIGFDDFKLSIEGDIAVRLSWSSHPDFVMSVGGFHPAYKINQSLQLPRMKRLTISLLRDNPRLVLTTYFAITANSIQFGARLDFYIGVSGFSVEGMFGFDVLFQISPFYFDARVQASLAVKAGGASILSLALDFSLRGPTPWIARGTAEFTILFFSVRVAFEARFGAELTTSMPDIAVLPELLRELNRPQNWIGQLDFTSTTAVTLIPIDTAADVVVVEAGGSLTISQRVLPLATPLSRFGTSRPVDISQATISVLRLGGEPAQGGTPAQSGATVTTSVAQEQFSPGAFGALKDDDKLSSASFVARPAGVTAAVGRDLTTSYVLPRKAQYDLIIMDSTGSAGAVESAPTKHEPSATEFTALARGGAAGQSAQAQDRRVRAQVGSVVNVGDPSEKFVVTGSADVRPRNVDGSFAVAHVDANGKHTWGADVALDRVDADRRAASLSGVQVIPLAQAVAV